MDEDIAIINQNTRVSLIKKFFKENSKKILSFILLLQIALGIFTLVTGLNIYLASVHQITSVLLVLSALNLYYCRAK